MKRLQRGTSRLKKSTHSQLDIFLNKSWLCLGEEKLENPNNRQLIDVDHSKTKFESLYFKKGDKLSFIDNIYDYIFSEYFFENLFLDETLNLFDKCCRILKPDDAMRIIFLDPDLIPIPEKIGFPDDSYAWNHPRKFKTRWPIYSITPALKQNGFEVVPIKNYNSDVLLNDRSKELPLQEHLH